MLKNYDKEISSFKFMPDNVDDRYKVEPDITLRSYQLMILLLSTFIDILPRLNCWKRPKRRIHFSLAKCWRMMCPFKRFPRYPKMNPRIFYCLYPTAPDQSIKRRRNTSEGVTQSQDCCPLCGYNMSFKVLMKHSLFCKCNWRH